MVELVPALLRQELARLAEEDTITEDTLARAYPGQQLLTKEEHVTLIKLEAGRTFDAPTRFKMFQAIWTRLDDGCRKRIAR